VILSTHILPEATAVCQKVVIINKGMIVAVDSPERLSSQFRQSERLSFTIREVDTFHPQKILALSGVTHLTKDTLHEGAYIVETELGRDVRSDLARTIIENGWNLLELKSLTVSLEEVFLHLTTEERAAGLEEVS
jgi:ABC-2 type transport system ATP-binding protein